MQMILSRLLLSVFISFWFTSYAIAGLSDGLIAYYPFNGDANDASGNGYNGNVQGATLTTDRFGNPDRAYSFDGVDDFIKIENSDFAKLQEFSICLWSKNNQSNTTSDEAILGLGYSSSGNESGHGLYYINGINDDFTSSQNVFTWVKPVDRETIYLDFNVNDFSAWKHYCYVAGSGQLKLYNNGNLTNSVPLSQIEYDSGSQYHNMTIGVAPTMQSAFMNGQVDELYIYNRVLSEAEISSLSSGLVAYYKFDGDLTDQTTYKNDGIATGNIDYSSGISNQSLDLTGQSGFVSADGGGELALSDWAISTWIKPNSYLSGNYGFVCKKEDSNLRYNYCLVLDILGGIRSQYEAASSDFDHTIGGIYGTYGQIHSGNKTIPTGSWSHVVSTRNSSTGEHKLYIDGELAASGVWADQPILNAENLLIGGHVNADSSYFDGSIDELRIYNRALSQVEVERLYDQNSPTILNKISGIVYDGATTNQPIDGATVILKNLVTLDESSIQTDVSGAYSFSDLLPGTYSLEVTKDGFKTIGEYGNDNAEISFDGYAEELTEDFHLYYCKASECYKDGVFFKIKDDPVKSSIQYDNDETAWDFYDQKKDYCGIIKNYECKADFDDAYNNEDSLYSNMLYAHQTFSLEQMQNLRKGLIKLVDKDGASLGERKPLILVHGWQGNDYAVLIDGGFSPDEPGDNSYLGFNKEKNLPHEYFQEFLAAYDVGCLGLGSDAFQFLCKNHKIYLYHYPSFKHITYNGRMLGEAIRSIPELWDYIQNNGKITIQAHSMGGLVSRSFIEEWGVGKTVSKQGPNISINDNAVFIDDKNGNEVLDKLITLATPHHGSPAAMPRWIKLGDSLKERNTPGALDIYWDDFDNAVVSLLGNKFKSRECLLAREGQGSHSCLEKGAYLFPERDKVRTFDILNNGGVVENVDRQFKDGSSYTYFHPNPWLRQLNQNVNTANYYFYGGSVVTTGLGDFIGCNEDELCDVLEPTSGFDATAGIVRGQTKYYFNDSVVPTASAFMDYSNTPWTKKEEEWRENITSFLKHVDFTNFHYLEDDVWHKSRFFYDYDHDKMRGGAGNNGIDNVFLGPSSYGDDWQDKNDGHASLVSLLIDMNYSGNLSDSNFDTEDASSRLYYEPLFLRVIMDLGFEGDAL